MDNTSLSSNRVYIGFKKAVAAMLALTVCASLGVGYIAMARPTEAYAVTTKKTVNNAKVTAKTASTVTVAWSAVAGASKYGVVAMPTGNTATISTGSEGEYTKFKYTTSTSATVSGLANNTQYVIGVWAIDSKGKQISSVNAGIKVTTNSAKATGVKSYVTASSKGTVTFNLSKGAKAKTVSPNSKVEVAYRASSSAKWKYKTLSPKAISGSPSGTCTLTGSDWAASLKLTSKKHDPQVKVRVINGSKKSGWTKTKHLKVTKKTTKETIETITVKKTKKGTKKTIKKTTKNKTKYSLKTANYTVK